MKQLIYILVSTVLALSILPEVNAQVDKRDVRRGNRDFRKEDYREADIDYRKALVKDSTSASLRSSVSQMTMRYQRNIVLLNR